MSRVPGPRGYERSAPNARARYASHPRHDGGEVGAAPFVVLLAFAVFLLVSALSVRQVTQPEPARNVIEAGVASLTEIDLVIAEQRDGLRSLAQQTNDQRIPLPGYPLDVEISRDAALNASNEELRQTILEDSSAVVYDHGLAAFDRTGQQSINTFSWQGLLEMGVGQVSKTTHERAGIAVLVTAVLTALAALALVMRSSGYGRLRNVGIAGLVAAIPGVLLVLGVRFFFGRVGGNDPFSNEVRDIVTSVTAVPLRNFVVLGVLGAAFVVLSLVLGWLSRNVAAFQPALAYEGGYDAARGIGYDEDEYWDEDEDQYEEDDDWDERER